MSNAELKQIKAIYSDPLSWVHQDRFPHDSLPASAICRGMINGWLAAACEIERYSDACDFTSFEMQLFKHWVSLPVIFTCMAAQRHRSYLLQTDYRAMPKVVTTFMKLHTGIASAQKQNLPSRLTLDELAYCEALSLQRMIPQKRVNMITLLFADRKNTRELPVVEFNMQLFILAQQHVIKQR